MRFDQRAIRLVSVPSCGPAGLQHSPRTMILDCHRDELVMASERAAFLLTRALGAVLLTSLRERPNYLSDPALRRDLLRMLMALVARDRSGPAGKGAKES